MNLIKNRKIIAALVIAVMVMTVLAGCGRKGTETVSRQEDQGTAGQAGDMSSESSSGGTEPEFKEPVQCPLCGNTVEKQAINQRAVAVMIENSPAARPQSGMAQADVVYELLAEGGITRFLAVYLHTSPAPIGPVRSSRHYFLDLVLEYNAIYAYFGFSPQAKADISKLEIQGINGLYDGYTYWRDDTRKQPHNAYTTMEKIRTRSEKLGYKNDRDYRSFSFTEGDYVPAIAAPEVKIHYPVKYVVGYSYDPEHKLYQRYINDKPHTDRETGKQLSARNIIIQYAATKVIDSEGRLDIKLVGEGNGYYITGGGMEKIKWKKKTRSSPTVFYDLSGSEIKLNPGSTWIQVLPPDAKVEFGGDSDENK